MIIDIFCFDWSGVISDDRKPVYESNMRILEKYKKPRIPFEEWLLVTELTAPEFLQKFGVNGSHKTLHALYKKTLDEVIKDGIIPVVYPDVKDTFHHIKDKEKIIAILSSHPGENLRNEAENYGIINYIDLILTDSKDKVQGLIDISKKLNKSKENILYTSDTIFDVRAAKEAGTYSATFICEPQRGYHSKEMLLKEKPDFPLNDLTDLVDDLFLG